MRNRRATRAPGFTILEAIVVVAIVGIAAGLLIPALGEMIRVTKITGVTRETASMLRKARYEAIKRGVPVRVDINLTDNRLTAFADVHGTLITDPPDGILNPIAGQPNGATDYVLQPELRMPSGISLQASDGFTGPLPIDKEIVFRTNGAVEDAGAVRIQDVYGNLLEIRITTATAARIEVLKWDGSQYSSQGEGGSAWQWK